MATILDKDVVRESKIKFDEREIQVTLTEDQKISMKLKGMKSGILSIDIESLYKQLNGEVSSKVDEIKEEVKPVKRNTPQGVDLSAYKGDDAMIISLHDVRHYFNIQILDYETRVKFDGIFADLIKERKGK